MSSPEPYSYRRILRRETHSPRSALAIALAVALIALCAYLGAEIILMMLNHRALLAAPEDMLTALGNLGTAPIAAPLITGIVLALIGLLLLIAALTPGRRARHQLPSERAGIVVDDEVVASALARRAAYAANANPDNTVATVSRSRAVVRITPTSGVPVQHDAVSAAVQEELAGFELTPPVRSVVELAPRGRVGE